MWLANRFPVRPESVSLNLRQGPGQRVTPRRPAANQGCRIQAHGTVNTQERGQVRTESCGGPQGGENSRVAQLPANTHTPHKHAQANGAGPASSVISRRAEGERACMHSRGVVRTVVKSHRSKRADTFDRLCRRRLAGLRQRPHA